MLPIEPLGLSANQWQFLSAPDKYVEASSRSDRILVPESTRRQFVTARDILTRLNGSCGEEPRRGILLADDVGLGKTTVAALVAWVVASAGERRGVRILAPNDVMMRRWEEELLSHVALLQECAPALDVNANRVKARRVRRLSPGSIQIVKHSYAASQSNLACDLLIVDEAHRAKGEHSRFSVALKRQKKYARRILILTATPFSIQIQELQRMLSLIGGESARIPVKNFSSALDDLYSGSTARSPEVVAEKLAARAKAAVDAIKALVVRHGIDDLPDERTAFGGRRDWNINVPAAKHEELELMVRMDRSLRLAKGSGSESANATNDPRFHVGWRHFDEAREKLKREITHFAEPEKAILEQHLKRMKKLRGKVGVHSKIAAVAAAVECTIREDEKVILFCHHHATAQELTARLASVLPSKRLIGLPNLAVWRQAWQAAIRPIVEIPHEETLRNTFIDWLCSDLVRTQTWGWVATFPSPETNLLAAMKKCHGRQPRCPETIVEAAQRLYHALLQSKSSRAVLKEAEDRPELLPGANGNSRVLGVCLPSYKDGEETLFIHNQQPDTLISIFNSPFGPDVLVVTDRLSEGIDLHRYCRHLIHYELDPSPIRTVQRNGRLRRVNSWAAATQQDIFYAYPAFRGTRDYRLVQIMKKRINSFSLLLGGVQDFNVDDVVGPEESWRNKVIEIAKKQLAAAGGQLRARTPGALA